MESLVIPVDGLEEKLGAVLSNPQLMQQIMTMAQSMGTQTQAPVQEASPPGLPEFDPGLLRTLSGVMGQTGVDRNQKALLQALNPYLGKDRLNRLERAMRAAKLARVASAFLGQSGFLSMSGR
ncbi:MAG: hypothetical protein IKC09_05250 [Oscillospiraceae bacterium]|nr:hypothetical protein [Oscillospiraceae bacterium]